VPSVRSHTQAARKQAARDTASRESAARPRPRKVSGSLPRSKIRWDRKFRAVMVVVFLLVGWIGLKAGLALIATQAQANSELRLVSALKKSNSRLEAQARALNERSTIVRQARALGMVDAGERPYVIVGLNQH